VRVLLGNSVAKEAYRDDDGALCHRPMKGRRVTEAIIPDDYTLMEAVSTIVAADGVWNHHSQGDAVDDHRPDWVESDNETVAKMLAEQLGCKVGRPKSWKADA
jgi:hypothetical protein